MSTRKRTIYRTIKFTPNQIRLLYTELSNSASCCADAQLRREYSTLVKKFNAVRTP